MAMARTIQLAYWHVSWQLARIKKNELALFIGKFSSVFEKQSALFLG
jgi:hypothetical protein